MISSEKLFYVEKFMRDAVREDFATQLRNNTNFFNKRLGSVERTAQKAAIAEKFAERAFTVANAASLGVIALQKSLATPRILTKVQGQKNQLAKAEIDKLFTTEGQFDFLRTVLSDEDNELLDNIEEHKAKENGAL